MPVGIVISASHNLPSDNGFKAYMSDGGQLAPHDKAVIEHVKAVTNINTMEFDAAISQGLMQQ